MPNLPIIPPSLPEGFCPETWQDLINEGVGKAVALFSGSGFTVVIDQESVPASTDQDKLWFRPSTGRIYKYTAGAWISPHPEPAGGDSRRLWVGTLVDLQTYDGGDAGAPGTNSGPMWEEDTDFRGRSPMHPGDIPSANPAKTLAVDENYGEGAHTQTSQEVAQHTHNVTFANQVGASYTHWSYDSGSPDGSINEPIGTNGPGTNAEGMTAQQNTYTTTQEAMPVIHPVRGAYLIKRTALRENYVAN